MAARAGRSQTINLGSRLGANNDPKNKYGGDGINFKARFVGSEDVMDNTGSKIAQAAIGRIRAACREAGGGKPKVLINLSFNGIKVADLKTKIWSINVPIPRVTYIAKDAEDHCVFCIIVARKKAGFKLFVYKAEQRITAQIVQSVRELFQLAYKMHQKKKKMEEAKTKSTGTLGKTTSDTAIARITSDSRLLDPPPQYEEEGLDPAYSMVDFPPPPKNQGPPPPKSQDLSPKNQDMVKTKPQENNNLVDISPDQPPPQNNEDIYAVPLSKTKRNSVLHQYGYQVPTSNQPALPSNHYQVPSNRPAFPDTTDAIQEWSALDAELAQIARELNMFGGNSSSTPEQPAQQQQHRLSHKQPSIVDPFQDDFFDQPFNPLQGEFFNQPDDSITFESSDPFSSPDISVLSDNIGDTNDDPFTVFEFDNPAGDKPTKNAPALDSCKETTTTVQQPLVDTATPPIPPDPLGVRLSLDEPPDETLQQSKISAAGNPFSITGTVGATTDKTTLKNWATFDSDFGAVSTDLNKAKKRSSMFEESLSPKQITTDSRSSNASMEQTVSPLQPPPRSRRRSSRPHTVYGEQSIKIDTQSQQPTPKKPLFDLASIKPKTVSKDDGTSKDPFMDLFMRMPDNNLANAPSNNNDLEYASTHL